MSNPTENSSSDIIYQVAQVSDRENILNFLRTHYYPEEPITNGNTPKLQDRADEEFSGSVIEHGTSIIAIDPSADGKILGAILSGPIHPGEALEMIEESQECASDNKKWSEILLLLAHLEANANIFKRYNIKEALHIHVLGVDKQYRGKSIGVNLLRKCLDVGKSVGYPLAKVDCTSVFSIRIAEKLQMECVYQLAYADYRDSNGKQLFVPPSPHTHIKTFIKFL